MVYWHTADHGLWQIAWYHELAVVHFPASEHKVCNSVSVLYKEEKPNPASENETEIRKCHLQEKSFFLLFA